MRPFHRRGLIGALAAGAMAAGASATSAKAGALEVNALNSLLPPAVVRCPENRDKVAPTGLPRKRRISQSQITPSRVAQERTTL